MSSQSFLCSVASTDINKFTSDLSKYLYKTKKIHNEKTKLFNYIFIITKNNKKVRCK